MQKSWYEMIDKANENVTDIKTYCSSPDCINTACDKNKIHSSFFINHNWQKYNDCEFYVTQQTINHLGWTEWLKTNKLK